MRSDHPLRKFNELLKLDFVREEVANFYGTRGNVSEDPGVIMKMQPGGEFQRRRTLVQLCLEASTKGIDRDQSNGTIRQQGRLLEELMNSARNLVSVLEIGGILLRSKWAAGKAQGGRISEPIRDRRATQAPAHFHHNPLGRVVSH